jgi:hypothetical protein
MNDLEYIDISELSDEQLDDIVGGIHIVSDEDCD